MNWLSREKLFRYLRNSRSHDRKRLFRNFFHYNRQSVDSFGQWIGMRTDKNLVHHFIWLQILLDSLAFNSIYKMTEFGETFLSFLFWMCILLGSFMYHVMTKDKMICLSYFALCCGTKFAILTVVSQQIFMMEPRDSGLFLVYILDNLFQCRRSCFF